MRVKIKKLHKDAVIPTYAKPGDAAVDLTAISISETNQYIEYGTGLSLEFSSEFVALLFPRSSLSKYDLILANHVGVGDSKFRGEYRLRFKKTGNKIYKIGDRVAQLMIIPRPIMEFEESNELSKTSRGSGGFGSSDK
jgi:dUTP pyrophosphatase